MYKHRLQAIFRESGFPVESYGDDHFVVSPEVVGELRELSYFDHWQLALSRRWYHVKMQDHSLFYFSEGVKPSYSFIHRPINVMSLPEYLESMGVEDNPRNRRDAQEDYRSVLDTASEAKYVTPIRFDYDPGSYRAGVHPAAHVHVGLDNQIRLCSNKMNAVSFVLFVMRHMYPKAWERLLQREGKDRFVSSIRGESTRLDDRYLSSLDRIELYMT